MVCGSKACVNYVKSYADLKFSDKTFAGYCIAKHPLAPICALRAYIIVNKTKLT